MWILICDIDQQYIHCIKYFTIVERKKNVFTIINQFYRRRKNEIEDV